MRARARSVELHVVAERPSGAHVVVGPDPYTASCSECGSTLRVVGWVQVDEMVELLGGFARLHEGCPERPRGKAATVVTGRTDDDG